jgi:two-component system, OmpR family, response regulator
MTQDAPLVLVVDDDGSDRALVSRLLIKNDYQVQTAENAKEALAFLEHTIPAMILLDVGLPDVLGFELCAAIKKRKALERIPVVFLTGRDTNKDFLAGYESGGVFYLSKNCGLDKLMTAINAVCGSRNRPASQPVAQNRISPINVSSSSQLSKKSR